MADAVASLIGFMQAIVLARALGAGGYGLLSVVIVFAGVFNQLVDLRLWETATKFVGEYHERRQHGHARAVIKLAYLLDGSTGLLAFLLVLVIARPAAEQIFHRPEAARLMICFSVTLLVSTVNQTSLALLRVFDRFTALGIERVAFSGLKFIAITWVAFSTRSALPIVWTYVAAELLRAVTLLVLALRVTRSELALPGPDSLHLLRARMREFITFSLHNSLSMLLALVTRELDVLILATFRGDQEVGYFRMAKNFAQLLLRLSNPVYHAIYPELVRMREQVSDFREIRSFITRIMNRVLLVVVPAAVMIALGAPIIIERLVDPEFLPAVVAVRIMIAGVLVNSAMLWTRPLALTAGRPDVATIAFAGSAVVLLVGSALLVPRFGYVGSAVVYLLTMSTAATMQAVGAARAARALWRPRG